MVSKLLKGRGLGLQVSCKSFPTALPLRRLRENDLQHVHVTAVHVCAHSTDTVVRLQSNECVSSDSSHM